MKKIYFIAVLLMAFVWYSCTKEDRLDHVDPNAPAPAQVANVKVEANPGGATLTYKIPKDANLAYVKAVYEIRPGVFREAKSSIYTDTLSLVGFGDTNTHPVQLFSVGKNEKESEPVSVQVTPLIAPVNTVFETVEMIATFGGVNVAFKNENKANLSVEVMYDSTGKDTWAPLTIFYTAAAQGNFSARGLKSEEKKFAVFLRDRWDNKSDTLYKTLTPKFEMQLSKDTWRKVDLPTDEKLLAGATYNLERLWDGLWATLGSGQSYASGNGTKLPQWFTIDLGRRVLLSRFKAHQAPSSHLYVGSAVKTFELYGSNSPNPSGSWESWQLLGTFRSFKPSGLPLNQTSPEDKNYANFLGEDFEFETPPPPVRFLRWKTLETYSSTGQVVISELTLFGEEQP